jgi:hypothetical protein
VDVRWTSRNLRRSSQNQPTGTWSIHEWGPALGQFRGAGDWTGQLSWPSAPLSASRNSPSCLARASFLSRALSPASRGRRALGRDSAGSGVL